MRIVVLSAFLDEIIEIKKIFTNLKEIVIAKRRCLVTQFNDHEIVICLSGVGTTSAASTTTAICEGFEPDLIILCGVAGGLDNNHRVGDLVIANKIIDADLYDFPSICEGTPYEANCLTDPHTSKKITTEYKVHPLLQEIGSSLPIERLKIGTVVTSNIFPAPKSLFSKIKNLNCSAIEMESSGVFKAAEYYDIPVMTIRAISNLLDDCGDDLGTEINALQICSERLSLCLSHFLGNISKLEEVVKNNNQNKIAELVLKYNLTQHPEGGWYRETFRSDDIVKAQGSAISRYCGESRIAGSSIIFLLSQGDYSAWHTVQSDETWNFHDGDPLLLRVINPTTGVLSEILLGLSGALQHTVKAGYIFSAESLGLYSIAGCMVTPGFEFNDFNLTTMDDFITNYSQHSNLKRLIRDKAVVDYDITNISEKSHGANFFTDPCHINKTIDETDNCNLTI